MIPRILLPSGMTPDFHAEEWGEFSRVIYPSVLPSAGILLRKLTARVSNGVSTQLLFNLCVTKLLWCFTGWWFQNHAKWIIGDHQSPVIEQKHVETDNQINNPLNNSRDLTTCSAFHSQGAFPTGLSRPCCRSLVSCCSILFVPGPPEVKLGATMGVADSTNGSFFLLPWGRESAKCSKWCMILHMLSVFSIFCMGRNTHEFIPTNSNSYHWIDWREHFTWKIPINLMDKNHIVSR